MYSSGAPISKFSVKMYNSGTPISKFSVKMYSSGAPLGAFLKILIGASLKILIGASLKIFRSIPKNFDRLRHYLLELNHNFSVISISETWLKQYNKTLYNIKGYTHVSQIREKRTGGGVSMFINNDIKYDVRDNITIFRTQNSEFYLT